MGKNNIIILVILERKPVISYRVLGNPIKHFKHLRFISDVPLSPVTFWVFEHSKTSVPFGPWTLKFMKLKFAQPTAELQAKLITKLKDQLRIHWPS
jgi:hypothetical protein